MIKKTLLIFAVFVLSLLVMLIATMPASIVWEHVVSPRVKTAASGIKVQTVAGSVWNGRVLLSYKSVPAIVSWDVAAEGLVTLTLPVHVQLESHAGKAELEIVAGLQDTTLLLKTLDANLAALNPLVRQQRIQLAGELFSRDLRLSIADRRIISAKGRFNWSGGAISYPAGRENHERIMPAFVGKFDTEDSGQVGLSIREQGGKLDLIEGSLTPEGQAMLEVRRALLDLADEPWSVNSSASDVVFKVKKAIY